jgi:acyl dehydratase
MVNSAQGRFYCYPDAKDNTVQTERRTFQLEILYFEDVVVNEKRTSSVTYTVEKKEIMEFAAAWDPRYFHVDEAEAKFSVFGGIVACSAHIFSILSWFSTHSERRVASMAALAFDELRMHRPVRPGDTLSCSFTCLEKRESRSKPDRGIIRTAVSMTNGQDEEVFSAMVTTMVAKRSG